MTETPDTQLASKEEKPINPAFVTMILDGIEYDDIVPQNYRYNIEIEDVIYGDELENGMVVLIEYSNRSWERSIDPNAEGLLTKNRWCSVTKIRKAQDDRDVVFIGEYADGHKSVRRYDKTTGWVVKKDSIPVCEVVEEEPKVDLPWIEQHQ